MVRQRIQIKKIDNLTARQVTFSKRRRGLFKKAHELSTLCDAEIAVVVFSATGKLYEFSSSSMMQIIERHKLWSRTLEKEAKLTLQPPIENAALRKELTEKTLQFRRLKGEELHGLGMEELMKLENLIEGGLNRVIKKKSESFMKEINTLKKKEADLKEENAWLKQKAVDTSASTPELSFLQSHSPNSTGSVSTIPSRLTDFYSVDTFLKLG